MSNTDDFVIENGVLKEYKGTGGDVTIPEGVTSIGKFAFIDCSSLTSVKIPDGVTSIGSRAFSRCARLTSVTIPDSVTSIGSSAFHDCSRLTSVAIPGSVTRIGDWAFRGCAGFADKDGFVIVKGILFDYTGSGGDVTIPDSVTSIGDSAFLCCSRLTSVTIPDSVTSIGSSAFQDCSSLTSVTIPESVTHIGSGAFKEINDLSVELKSSKMVKSLKFPAEFTKFRLIIPNDGKMLIPLFQSGKQWETWIANKLDKKASLDKMITYLDNNPTDRKKLSKRMAWFVLSFYKELEPEKIRTLFKLMDGIPSKDLDAIKDNSAIRAYLGEQLENESPLEKHARTAMMNLSISPEIRNLKHKGIKYAMSDKLCTLEVVQYLLYLSSLAWQKNCKSVFGEMSYVSMLPEDGHINVHPDLDQIAAELDRRELSEFLESLLSVTKYRDYLVAWAKYADDDSIARVAAIYNKLVRGNAKERYYAENIRNALLINDSRAAMQFADKAGSLEAYAKLRGVDAETLRDTVLIDFGLDENGKKTYDLGGVIVAAALSEDLKLSLFDETAKKEVKSIPKRNADEAKYNAAKEDYSRVKKDIRNVVKLRNKRLFEAFLEGRSFGSNTWAEVYTKNAVLNRMARLLVWMQGAKTFTMSAGGPIDSTGQSYAITDKPIKVAHPMEMDASDVQAWQKYFTSHGLKQPFAQIWEPVIDPKTVAKDRYAGCMIPYYRFNGQAKHGITVEDYDFHNDITITLADCDADVERIDWRRHEIRMEDRFEVKSFRCKKYTRQVNHIVAYLDRITVWDRVKMDDIGVMEIMDRFTLAQVTEFIKAAQEANAVNVLAALMDYKNTHFAEFDPMDEFVLD